MLNDVRISKDTIISFLTDKRLLIAVSYTDQLLNMFSFLRLKYLGASNSQISEVIDDNTMRHLLIYVVFNGSQKFHLPEFNHSQNLNRITFCYVK